MKLKIYPEKSRILSTLVYDGSRSMEPISEQEGLSNAYKTFQNLSNAMQKLN